MSLILTAPPVSEPISLGEAKAHLRIPHDDDNDFITSLIKVARQQVEQRCGLALIQQGWSLFLDDWPLSGEISLSKGPLIDVTDIKVWSDSDVPATIDPAHYYEDKTSLTPRLCLRGSRSWTRPGRIANGIEILLLLGFGSNGSTVPEALRQAVLQLVGHWFAERGDEAPAPEPLTVSQLIKPFR